MSTLIAGFCILCGEPYVVLQPHAIDTGTCSKRCSRICKRPDKHYRRLVREQLAKLTPAEIGTLQRSCRNKVRHGFRRDAETASIRVMLRRKEDPQKVSVYQCPVCDYWHWGNSTYLVRFIETARPKLTPLLKNYLANEWA